MYATSRTPHLALLTSSRCTRFLSRRHFMFVTLIPLSVCLFVFAVPNSLRCVASRRVAKTNEWFPVACPCRHLCICQPGRIGCHWSRWLVGCFALYFNYMNDRDILFPQDLVMRSMPSSTVMTTSSPMHFVPSSIQLPESLCGKYSPRPFLSSKNWFVLSCATRPNIWLILNAATGTMLINSIVGLVTSSWGDE